jgi:alanine-alpha-ketoisovalerate/valine-pyruvate aminotransferase
MKNNFTNLAKALESHFNENKSLKLANQVDRAFTNYKNQEEIELMAKEITEEEAAINEALEDWNE